MSRPRTVEDETLLLKAMNLFWRHGYAKTGVRELEHALGVKAPSLYNRFGSKEALFHAAIAHYLEHVVRFRVDAYLRDDDPLQGLRRFFDTTYEYMDESTPALSCLLVNTSVELGATDATVAALLARGRGMIRTALRATLLRAQRAGALRADANIEILADYLYLGLQGLLLSSKVEPDRAVLKRRTNALFAMLPTKAARTRKRAHKPGAHKPGTDEE